MASWKSVAQRWSGRGRIRTFVVIASLLLAVWNPIYQICGLLLFIMGSLLHVAAKGHLIRNAQVCREGPYGWVRHPFYAANFLIDLGLCFFSGGPWLPLVYGFVFFLSYMPRILAEEEMLTEKFGSDYGDYKRSVPRLIPSRPPNLAAWLKAASIKNLIEENEISRAIRLSAYPFFFAMVLEWRSEWFSVSDTSKWAWIVGFGMAAFALWLAGEVIHRAVEDGQSVVRWSALPRLWNAWLLLPLLPLVDDQPWLMSLEVEHHDVALFILGGALAGAGIVSAWLFRDRKNQYPYGLGLACCAFGSVAASEFVAFAPLFALSVWLAWFYVENFPKHTELKIPRLSMCVPAFGIATMVVLLAVMELFVELPH